MQKRTRNFSFAWNSIARRLAMGAAFLFFGCTSLSAGETAGDASSSADASELSDDAPVLSEDASVETPEDAIAPMDAPESVDAPSDIPAYDSGFVSTANRVYYENFDDQDVSSPMTFPYCSDGECTDFDWVTGRDGSGYAVHYPSNTSETDATFAIKDSTWLAENLDDEIYIRFWIRYPFHDFSGCGSNCNLKFNYCKTVGGGYASFTWFDETYAAGGSACDNDVPSDGEHWDVGTINIHDGGWHLFELYWNIGFEERFVVGIDDNIELDRTFTNCWDDVFRVTSVPSIDALNTTPIRRYIDDYEIWDGLPPDAFGGTLASPSDG